MEFDDEDHEDQDEELEIQLSSKMAGEEGSRKSYRYRECQKNHAVAIGGHAVDGCGEFIAAGEEGSLDGLKCAACNCHRNFHRKETEGEGFHQPQPQQQQQNYSACYHRGGHGVINYMPISGSQHRPLALPSTSRDEHEDVSNPSSSGGGGGGGAGSRKRFRTKFTQEQKDKLLEFSERLGWRIQKQDEAVVEHFCSETGVKRQVLKVWMHNNKNTIGKKNQP